MFSKSWNITYNDSCNHKYILCLVLVGVLNNKDKLFVVFYKVICIFIIIIIFL